MEKECSKRKEYVQWKEVYSNGKVLMLNVVGCMDMEYLYYLSLKIFDTQSNIYKFEIYERNIL